MLLKGFSCTRCAVLLSFKVIGHYKVFVNLTYVSYHRIHLLLLRLLCSSHPSSCFTKKKTRHGQHHRSRRRSLPWGTTRAGDVRRRVLQRRVPRPTKAPRAHSQVSLGYCNDAAEGEGVQNLEDASIVSPNTHMSAQLPTYHHTSRELHEPGPHATVYAMNEEGVRLGSFHVLDEKSWVSNCFTHCK